MDGEIHYFCEILVLLNGTEIVLLFPGEIWNFYD